MHLQNCFLHFIRLGWKWDNANLVMRQLRLVEQIITVSVAMSCDGELFTQVISSK